MQTPNHVRQITSGRVATRCGLRVAMVAALAYYSPHGFARTFVLLLAVCAGLAAIFATLRHEPVFGPTLTHWEESALYAVLCFLSAALFEQFSAR